MAHSKNLVLARDIYAVGLQPLNPLFLLGNLVREIDEGTLPAGTLVRDVEHVTGDEVGIESDVVAYFEASTDGGATWHRQRAYERVETMQGRYLVGEELLGDGAASVVEVA